MNYNDNQYNNLSDEEFLRIFGKEYEELIAEQNDADYEVNPVQWSKMISVMGFFLKLAKDSNGTVEPCVVSPRLMHGGVTAYFTAIDIKEDNIERFCDAMMKTSAITIDATTDGRVCISVSVPNVFREKK